LDNGSTGSALRAVGPNLHITPVNRRDLHLSKFWFALSGLTIRGVPGGSEINLACRLSIHMAYQHKRKRSA
jgi:hypothetical protein